MLKAISNSSGPIAVGLNIDFLHSRSWGDSCVLLAALTEWDHYECAYINYYSVLRTLQREMGHVIYKSRCFCNATAFWSERHDSAVFHRHLPLILSRDRISGRCILYSFECVSQCSCLWYEQNKKSFWIMYTIVSKFTLCIYSYQNYCQDHSLSFLKMFLMFRSGPFWANFNIRRI